MEEDNLMDQDLLLINLLKLLMLLEINWMLFAKVEFIEELTCLKLYH